MGLSIFEKWLYTILEMVIEASCLTGLLLSLLRRFELTGEDKIILACTVFAVMWIYALGRNELREMKEAVDRIEKKDNEKGG